MDTMVDAQKIIRVPIKDVWRYEDKHLTPWLSENIDVVSNAIGFHLCNAECEISTGNFNVDIKAEDELGNNVVIENQYGNSDHDHLGKLITYLTSFKAKTAIWIVETPKQEHINAISWLNEADNNCDFFLLTIQAIKIGDSKPAPLLSKIVGPSEESRKIGKLKKEDTERHKLRLLFWTKLLEKSREIGLKSFNSISASKDSGIGVTAGVRGLSYCFWVNQLSMRIEVRIDRGRGAEEENLRILKCLEGKKQLIETKFGSSLLWDDLEGYRVCSIRKEFQTGGYKSVDSDWDEIINEVVGEMLKLEKATKDHIKVIK